MHGGNLKLTSDSNTAMEFAECSTVNTGNGNNTVFSYANINHYYSIQTRRRVAVCRA